MTNICFLFWKGATSSSGEMVPEAVDHVGIVVYGHLYEFGDLGILRTVVRKKYKNVIWDLLAHVLVKMLLNLLLGTLGWKSEIKIPRVSAPESRSHGRNNENAWRVWGMDWRTEWRTISVCDLNRLILDCVKKFPIFLMNLWMIFLHRGSNYDVVSRSCVVWAMHACDFLEVPYPENWDKLCDWAEEK